MKYAVEVNQRIGKKISGRWLNKIVEQTLGTVGVKNAEISIAFIGDRKVRELNKTWRGKDKVTDVLSFTYEVKPLVGEIIICYPEAKRQAKECGRGPAEEIKILLIHGLLHLAGYDHEKGARQARLMDNLQNKIVKLLSK